MQPCGLSVLRQLFLGTRRGKGGAGLGWGQALCHTVTSHGLSSTTIGANCTDSEVVILSSKKIVDPSEQLGKHRTFCVCVSLKL